MKHKILILGQDGFLGKHIIDASSDFEFTGFSIKPKIQKKSSVETYEYPSDDALIKIFKSESFTHLLFLSWPPSPPHDSLEHSLFASYGINLCRLFLAINPKAHIYFAGSIHETGQLSGLVPNSFEGNSVPQTLYGQAKRFVWASLQKLCPDKLCWFRLSNIYGPYDHPGKVLSLMVDAHINKKDFILKNPHTIVDFVHIKDATQGILQALRQRYSGVINIGSGTGYYLSDIQDQNSVRLLPANPTKRQKYPAFPWPLQLPQCPAARDALSDPVPGESYLL